MPDDATHPSPTATSPVRRWAGTIGAAMAAGLGVAHLAVNTIGFAEAAPDERSIRGYLLVVVLPSVLAWAIAVVAWVLRRPGRPGHRQLALRIATGVGGILMCALAARVGLTRPAQLFLPMGPGLWTVIGGPALVVAALAGPRR